LKIAIGTDHAGIEHKEAIKKLAASMDIEVLDMGTNSSESVDYPDYGEKVGLAVCKGQADMGILICGTGIGMSLAANKIKQIRAAVCWNEETVSLAREHNNANILCMGARFIPVAKSVDMVKVFLTTDFSSEKRHIRRVDKITAIEERSSSSDCR
jgi:ribose 5-phosphate isomerase B